MCIRDRSKDNNLEAFYLATPDGRFEALNNKGEYIFIRNSVPGLSSYTHLDVYKRQPT
ncbi:protein RhsD [Escherichia coli]|nr:protein RhsD [Escherichia coli]